MKRFILFAMVAMALLAGWASTGCIASEKTSGEVEGVDTADTADTLPAFIIESGLKLDNVRASVVRNHKAPLLLGQSVLGLLGKIEIENKNKKLIITR